ncbi:MAG: acylphosphatase [Candidatus Omnitrophota bacterium]
MKTSSKKTSTLKRLHIFYSGSVQGIGFRYTAERLAVSLNLSGWVKNLPDGRVEVICEGKESDIGAFLAKIDDVFKGYVRSADADWSEATGEFEQFDVRF